MNYFGSFGSTEKTALDKLLPTVDHALGAHESGDYDSYLLIITHELSEKVSREGFEKAHTELFPYLGKLGSKTFLGSFKRGLNPMLLFAAKYANTEDDILINVTFKNGTEPPLIDWLWIE